MVSGLWLMVWHSVRHHALRIYRLLFLADGMLFTASMAPSLAIRRTRWSVVPSKIPAGGAGIALAFWFRLVVRILGYITQGVPVGALVGCYEPTAQVLLYSYTHTLSPSVSNSNPGES